jgi:hypothetical protein
MSNTTTKKMLRAYFQRAQTSRFLSSLFQTPPENFYNSETVEIDIEREDEDIAIAVTDLSTGYRSIADDLYVNKEFKPPIFKESFPLNVVDLIKRQPGQNPYASFSFQSNATLRFMKGARKLEARLRRAIEQACAQVLTTGTVTLTDSASSTLYTIDYKPKSDNFQTVSAAWSGGSATIVNDLITKLLEPIRDNGLTDPVSTIWGSGAFENAIKDTNFKARFDTRRIDLGTIAPFVIRGAGGQYRGQLDLGNYKIDIWTYNGKYKDPATGNKVPYVPTDKVIGIGGDARLDLTFGAIPRAVPIDQRLLKFLPNRASSVEGGVDMFWNAWVTPEGDHVFGGLGARPLPIPTSIDRIGCLDTEP